MDYGCDMQGDWWSWPACQKATGHSFGLLSSLVTSAAEGIHPTGIDPLGASEAASLWRWRLLPTASLYFPLSSSACLDVDLTG